MGVRTKTLCGRGMDTFGNYRFFYMESQASMAHRAKMFIGLFLNLLIDYFVENIGPVIKQCG